MSSHSSLISPGDLFEGGYEILSRLGEGGFGTVYQARQLTTGQSVALKIMHARDPARLEQRSARFRREMQLCAQLHHPNIVQLIDAGESADGVLYTVFAFAPGQTLAEVLDAEGPLSPAEARHLMLQVLDALACAHARGVIHRDLKPGNIMVNPTGARRNAVVLDFGIGALAGAGPDAELLRLTGTGEILGTPGYAAPEQLRGLELSPRSDLFAWGLVFVECLVGAPVYTGNSMPEILHAQLDAAPVPVPPALEGHPLGELLRRATAKKVAERDVSARELFAELEVCELPATESAVLGAAGGSLEGLVPGPHGRRLAPTPGAPTGEPAPTSPGSMLQGERRQITALCCAVDAISRGHAAPDSEDIDEIVRAALEDSAALAQQHGGRVMAALGDQVLIYFGYPRAEGDDARRAARAALAMIAAVKTRNEALEARSVHLEARVGLHTGLVVAWGEHRAASGRPVVGTTAAIAAWLSRQAAPGSVAITTESQRLVRAHFDTHAAGRDVAPGSARPAPIYRLGPARVASASVTSDQARAPLVGREREMDLLLERWSRSRRGAGQSIFITGEPGIGKSRLIAELRARVASEAHVHLEGRCSPDTRNTVPYPIVDLLARAFALQGETSTEASIARLEAELHARGFAPAEAMPLFLPLFSLPVAAPYAPLEISPQRHKEQTLSAILALLFAMAEEQPVLLVIEDLHWADASTIELLTRLVREVPSAPICLLLTARPELAPPFATVSLLQLHLNRLEPADVEAMITRLGGGTKAVPATLLEQVVSRTDGVPLFIEELMRMMSESHVLIEHGDRYELARPLADAAIPSTLRDLLTARLDRLGRARETAQIAAALGREFALDLLAAVSPLDADAVREDLERLADAGLVHQRHRIRNPAWVFKHALIRDAAYESLPRATRRHVHALIARALEERFPELVEARPDLVAHHLARADEQRKAIGYAQRAAGSALMRSACAEAIAHARDALAWLGSVEDARERAEIELALNGVLTPALMMRDGYATPEVEPVLTRSQELVEELGDSPYVFPTLWALITYHHTAAHRQRARALAGRMVELAERGPGKAMLALALVPLGNCMWMEGELEAARQVLERALALYDADEHEGFRHAYALDARAWASMSLAPVLWALGYPEQARRSAEAALAWAHELRHINSIALAYIYLGSIHYYNGDRDRALATADALKDVAERHDLAYNNLFGRLFRGWATREVDEPARILADLEGMGQLVGMTFYRAMVSEALAALGRHDEALAGVEACLDMAERTGERYNLATLHRLRGVYLLARDGAEEQAAACFRQAMDAARAQGATMLELQAAAALCRLPGQRGQDAPARDRLRALCARMTEGFESSAFQEARALLDQADP